MEDNRTEPGIRNLRLQTIKESVARLGDEMGLSVEKGEDVPPENFAEILRGTIISEERKTTNN